MVDIDLIVGEREHKTPLLSPCDSLQESCLLHNMHSAAISLLLVGLGVGHTEATVVRVTIWSDSGLKFTDI